MSNERLEEIRDWVDNYPGYQDPQLSQAFSHIKTLLSLLDRPVCKWKLTSSEFGPVWSTGCGDVHEVTDGHSLHPFCACCGGKLEEVIPAVEDNDE